MVASWSVLLASLDGSSRVHQVPGVGFSYTVSRAKRWLTSQAAPLSPNAGRVSHPALPEIDRFLGRLKEGSYATLGLWTRCGDLGRQSLLAPVLFVCVSFSVL